MGLGGFNRGALLGSRHCSWRQAVWDHTCFWLSSLLNSVAADSFKERCKYLLLSQAPVAICGLDHSKLASKHPGDQRDTGQLSPAGGAVAVHKESES